MADERYERKMLFSQGGAQAAVDFNSAPEFAPESERKLEIYTKPISVNDTFTAKEFREIRAAKRANCVCIALTAAVVLLGITAILRFSSVFEISKQTRLLNNATAGITESIVLDETKLNDLRNSVDTDAVAAQLGLQKPQRYQIEKIKLDPSDMTVIHEAGADAAKENTV